MAPAIGSSTPKGSFLIAVSFEDLLMEGRIVWSPVSVGKRQRKWG